MKVTVKTTTCDIILEVEPSNKVKNVKDNIQLKTGIHPRFQKLCFSNKELEDERKLSDYRIKNSSTIDFELIVPSLDEVLDAMTSIKYSIDSHNTCTNEDTGTDSDQVSEAMIILKAFIDSHSCCAIAITEMLKKNELAVDKHSKIKTLCETLLRENRVLTTVRDEQIRRTAELELKVQNLETELANTKVEFASMKAELANTKAELANPKVELANTKAELANTKAELANAKVELANTKAELASTKVELENQKSINQTLFEKVEFVSSAQSAMDQKISELTARFSIMYD